jgi:hypothetical protein
LLVFYKGIVIVTETQQHGAAAGFLHVLHTSPDVFQKWIELQKGDYAGIGSLLQESLGLAETPTPDDLHAMTTHIATSLKTEVEAFAQANPTAPRHAGGFVGIVHEGD